MNIAAFAGSNSSTSINRRLVKHVLTYFNEDSTNLLDLNDFEMSLYSIDREKKNGIPKKAHRFREHMHNAEIIICSLAEHNRSYTVAFKNILDWCSRVDLNIFGNNPTFLMSTSPGGYGGGNVMEAATKMLPGCGADIVTTYSLPSFYDNFSNEDEDILDEELAKNLEDDIQLFKNNVE